MAKKDAEVTIGANADAVTRAMAVGKAAAVDFATSVKSALGGAFQSVASDMQQVVLAQGRISFSQQHQGVREFEASSARMAIAMGRDLEAVRGGLEATGVAIGKRPQEVAAWATEVGKLTYNFKGAADGIRGISALAAETGRSVDDYRGLAVELGTVGKVSGDTTHALGVMHAQADQFKTVGGIAAFAGQVEALSETISRFAGKSEEDFLKVTAAAAALGKGLSDSASRRVQQSALGAVASDPLRWERYLGRQITDEHGQVNDPTKVLQEITEKTKRRYGSDARRVLMLNFGAETGAAMFGANYSEAAKAAGLSPSTKPGDAQAAYLATDAGKREVAQAQLAESARELLGSSTLLGRAADSLQQFAAHNPISSTLIAVAMGGAMSSFMSTFGKSIATMMGGKGEGGAVGGVIDLATKGTGVKGLLGKLGLLGMAGAAGYTVGTYIDEATGASDWISGTGGHNRIKSSEDEKDIARDAALKLRITEEKKKAAQRRVLPFPSGFGGGNPIGDDGVPSSIAFDGAPGPKSGGQASADAAKLTAAVEKLGNAKFTIVNKTGGPVEVTDAAGHSAAAGGQGG